MSSNSTGQVGTWREFALLWRRHRHTDNAAALAFYSLFSLAPLLLIGVTVAGAVLGERAAQGELERQLTAVVGGEAAAFIDNLLRGSARFTRHASPLGYCVTTALLLYSGSHVLSKLREALNQVNGVAPGDPARPLLRRIAARFLCASLLLAFGVVLVLGVLAEGVFTYLDRHLTAPVLGGWHVSRGYVSLTAYLLLTVAFALVLKILPRRRPLWRHALAGALVAALACGSLNGALDLYLRSSFLASLFSTGFTILAFLLWLFLSIQAFLAGAELAAMLGRHRRKLSSR